MNRHFFIVTVLVLTHHVSAAQTGSVPSQPVEIPDAESATHLATPEEEAKRLLRDLGAAAANADFKGLERIGREIRAALSLFNESERIQLMTRLERTQADLLPRYLDSKLDKVAKFSETVARACLEGVSILELEKLKIEAIGISLPNDFFSVRGGMDPWRERLNSVNQTLNSWIQIQNLIDRGYAEEALKKISYLIKGPQEFPILDRKELEKLTAELELGVASLKKSPKESVKIKVFQTLQSHLDGVEDPDATLLIKVSIAVAELESEAEDGLQIRREIRDLSDAFDRLARTREALADNEFLRASYHLPEGDAVDVFRPGYYAALRERFGREIIREDFKELSAELPPTDQESIEDYLLRLFTSSQLADDPQTRLRILKRLLAMDKREHELPVELKSFLSSHGDFVRAEVLRDSANRSGALKLYRAVASTGSDQFGLADLAQKRIDQLKVDSPEIFEDASASLAEEVKAMNESIRTMTREMAALKKTIDDKE